MRLRLHLEALALVALLLAGCDPQPVIQPEPPLPVVELAPLPSAETNTTPIPTAPAPTIPPADKPPIVLPPPPPLTAAGTALVIEAGRSEEAISAGLSDDGRGLILEFETGGRSGYDPHPEAPDARLSGITWGIGYDGHYNSPAVIRMDWRSLAGAEHRLAEMHPYYGRSAQANLPRVHDITVPWKTATTVFDLVDVAREFAKARRAMPGIEDLRPNAQAALISLGFNRGWGMAGANRTEMRAIRDAVPARDYSEIALQLRKMVRVWRGTSIERGMTRRRLAEANLVER